jgi:hypothetical protein
MLGLLLCHVVSSLLHGLLRFLISFQLFSCIFENSLLHFISTHHTIESIKKVNRKYIERI